MQVSNAEGRAQHPGSGAVLCGVGPWGKAKTPRASARSPQSFTGSGWALGASRSLLLICLIPRLLIKKECDHRRQERRGPDGSHPPDWAARTQECLEGAAGPWGRMACACPQNLLICPELGIKARKTTSINVLQIPSHSGCLSYNLMRTLVCLEYS